MTDGQAFGNGIFSFKNVDIRATDGGRGYSHQRIVGANIWNRFVSQLDPAGLNEYSSFHHGSHDFLIWTPPGLARDISCFGKKEIGCGLISGLAADWISICGP
jgi:hypothetical protein